MNWCVLYQMALFSVVKHFKRGTHPTT